MFCAIPHDQIISLFSNFNGQAQSQPDAIVDYFGVSTPILCAPYLADRVGQVIESPPFPDDSIRASFVEYLALTESIQKANADSYIMMELGASYAPFAVLAATLARRLGIADIRICAVEAARNAVNAITSNFDANNLNAKQIHVIDDWDQIRALTAENCNTNTSGVQAYVVNGAYSSNAQTIWFPDVDCTIDNGGKVADDKLDVDCRGMVCDHFPVKAFTFDQLLGLFPADSIIDLAHIDIQGAELTVVPDSISHFNQRVKRVMLGTHSRLIEGEMIKTFHRNGWILIAEEPCGFNYNQSLGDIVGMTTKDGSQYWVNSRFT